VAVRSSVFQIRPLLESVANVKVCLDCGIEGVRVKYCAICRRKRRAKKTSARVIAWRRKAKLMLVEMHGGKCRRCGYAKCIRALQFHHLDPEKKTFSISNPSTKRFQILIEEAYKCELLCANCHAEVEDKKFIDLCPEMVTDRTVNAASFGSTVGSNPTESAIL
jgi:hypothetical protein